jgi:hypothetical protein
MAAIDAKDCRPLPGSSGGDEGMVTFAAGTWSCGFLYQVMTGWGPEEGQRP